MALATNSYCGPRLNPNPNPNLDQDNMNQGVGHPKSEARKSVLLMGEPGGRGLGEVLATRAGALVESDTLHPNHPMMNSTLRSRVQLVLKDLRDSHTVEGAREHYNSSMPSYSLFEMATGGCLDSLSAAFAGFRHLGGTEDVSTPLGKQKALAFQDLTNAKCYGDTRNYESWIHLIDEPDYVKAGQPCTDYASLGKQLGRFGKKGGDLFMLQVDILLKLNPKIIRLGIKIFDCPH